MIQSQPLECIIEPELLVELIIVPDGKPVIGSVPGLQNLYLAAGHEGGGLSMVSQNSS